ncbi:hypothetical protein BURMUCF2_3580 [Burkholderia multivorans CF2]|nr:hypothetical protein BURMUCF2_3580 [Burkholderia multivorans CF2]
MRFKHALTSFIQAEEPRAVEARGSFVFKGARRWQRLSAFVTKMSQSGVNENAMRSHKQLI